MTADCIDFEDLTIGKQYLNGDSFVADDTGFQAKITLEDFQWSSGGMTSDGYAEVQNGGLANGSGQELQVNNTLLRFDFEEPVSGLTMKYGEYGGNLNIEINGDPFVFEDFVEIGVGTPTPTLGGVEIYVIEAEPTQVGQIRLVGNIDQLKIGGQELWIDDVCLEIPNADPQFDFGDAPDSYGTTQANFGPSHLVAKNVYLGRLVDPEFDGMPSANADRDDIAGTTDDEDGVKFTSAIVAGQVADVEVIASTDGWLNAWADFNQDGQWTSKEQIFDAVPVSAGINVLNFSVSENAVTNETTYTRWRFSDTHKHLEPTTVQDEPRAQIPNGEVEDHPAVIRDGNPEHRFDFGDAPDSYRTTLANTGPSHRIEQGVHLGAGVDAEPDGQPSPNATRDDAAGFDDEDGVNFVSPLVAGDMTKVEVTASVDGWLNAWVDFDGSGSWSLGEQIYNAQPVSAGVNVLNFMVPAGSVTNELTYSRWRFSTEAKGLPYHGEIELRSVNGEVEDHALRIQDPPKEDRVDFGDLPDSYQTLLVSNGARHEINPNIYLGKLIDADSDGQPSPGADRDDSNTSDDEDGIRFLTPMLPGTDAKVEVTASEDGWLNAWVDFNRDGTFDPTTEAIATAEFIPIGTTVLTFPVPKLENVEPHSLAYSRFRFSSDTKLLGPFGVNADGTIPNGEVEDYAYMNGDLDGDLDRDIDDVDIMSKAIKDGSVGKTDLNCDGTTDQADMDLLIEEIFGTYKGDTDLDGDVDFADFLNLSANFGKSPDASWADGDFDSDCEVGFTDFLLLSKNFGKTANPAAVDAAFA